MNVRAGPERIAILTPTGRDQQVAQGVVIGTGLDPVPCRDLADLLARLEDQSVGLAMVADEALTHADLSRIERQVAAQPAWSDFPFIVLTRQGGRARSEAEQRITAALANVTFLERPFHATTLASLLQTALRARRRQYETRDILAAVRVARENLAFALSAGELGDWELSLPRRTLQASPTGRRHLGHGPLDALDLASVQRVLDPADLPGLKAAIRRAIDHGESFSAVCRCRWPDGTQHWVEVTGRARLDASGRVDMLLGITADVTRRVEAELDRERLVQALSRERAELEQRVGERTLALVDVNQALQAQMAARDAAELQLRQVQKLETIGQLVGGVAHDFNNLLMVINSNLELLRRRLGDSPLLRFVEGARRGAKRGADLTQRLLAYARKQDLQPETVDVGRLVEGLMALIERSVGPRVLIRLHEQPGLPPVRVDPNQLEMALLNLAVNARDAMNGAGELEIGMSLPAPGTRLAGMAAAGMGSGEHVCLWVRDHGSGMDAATLARAVEPFFSTKGVGKGTGLGLSMVHGLAQQSGGAFQLDSQPGLGTTATLWLPVSDGMATQPAELEPASSLPIEHGHVLLVDDDELVAHSTAAMLDDLGYRVTIAGSASAALNLLDSGLAPSLVLTDHAMPGMTGAELAQSLRRSRPGLPILIATGYADLTGQEKFDAPRLIKPYDQQQLAQELSRLKH